MPKKKTALVTSPMQPLPTREELWAMITATSAQIQALADWQNQADARADARQAKADARADARQAKADAQAAARQAKADAQANARQAQAEARQAKAEAQAAARQAKADARQAKAEAQAEIRQAKAEAQAEARQAKAEARQAQAEIRQAKADARADARWTKTMAAVNALASDNASVRQRIEDAEKARGRAAEVMFRHAMPAVLKKAGFGEVQVEPRRLRREDREYDFVARNGKANFVGEVKVRFKTKHLARLRDLLNEFRKDYPGKAGDRAVYGVVCGLVVDEEAADLARKRGLLVVEGRAAAELRVHPRRLVNYAK